MSTTERLYYSQPALRAFDATVVRTEPRGTQTAVWLDRTAFYPTSGGQPHDLGTLAGAPVVDVQDDDAGEVMHLVGADAPQAGAAVHLHGAAADRLMACGNGPVGLTAGEVIDPARALFNSWVSGKVAL